MSVFTIQPAKNVLLTGAGFTKPFRGYLASEMWALILSQPEIYAYPKLRQCLLGNLNFEEVYDLVSQNKYSEYNADERKAYVSALEKSYEYLHDATCKDFQIRANQLCHVFISRFGRVKPDEVGFVFTLNHDLFLERYFSMDFCNVSIPGLHGDTWFHARHSERFEVKHTQLPSGEKVEALKSRFWGKKKVSGTIV